MILSEKYTPSDKIDGKLAERNVLNVEINALMSLRRNKKTNEFEMKLAKEYYDYLQQKVLICDKEIYSVFYEEIPPDSPDRDELLERIESEDVALWTYKSDIPIKPNTLKMDVEAYKALSYREKIERKIAEHNILDSGITAIMKRRKSKKITEFEAILLKAREYELKGLLLACIKEIWSLDWDVPPGDKETLQRIKEANITKARYDALYNSMKNLRQNHV